MRGALHSEHLVGRLRRPTPDRWSHPGATLTNGDGVHGRIFFFLQRVNNARATSRTAHAALQTSGTEISVCVYLAIFLDMCINFWKAETESKRYLPLVHSSMAGVSAHISLIFPWLSVNPNPYNTDFVFADSLSGSLNGFGDLLYSISHIWVFFSALHCPHSFLNLKCNQTYSLQSSSSQHIF